MSTAITAASRASNTIELWWPSPNGSVEGRFWYLGGVWGSYQHAGPGSTSTTASIAGLSRLSSSLELWWVAPNGSVQQRYWSQSAGWNGQLFVNPGSAAI